MDGISFAARVLPAGAPLTLRLKGPTPWRELQGWADIASQIGALTGRCGFERLAGPGMVVAEGDTADRQQAGLSLDMTFRRTNHRSRWRMSGLADTDVGAFAALFAVAFQHPISIDLWRWKYGEGRGVAVCAWRGPDLIAHYGGMLRQVMAFGLPVTALQVCDAMVAPKERGVLGKAGAMFQVTATFLELYQGLARVPLAFGFPSQRAMALGELTGLYAEVGKVSEVSWPARNGPPLLGTRLIDFQPEQQAHQQALNNLWQAMARELVTSVVGVRDLPYLRYRYLEHPEHRYRLVLMRRRLTASPLGLLILRQMGRKLALVDWVAPLRQLPLLLKQARRLAALWGHDSLYGWIPSQHLERFHTSDMDPPVSEVRIPTNAWIPQPYSVDQLRGRWWLVMGDTDFL